MFDLRRRCKITTQSRNRVQTWYQHGHNVMRGRPGQHAEQFLLSSEPNFQTLLRGGTLSRNISPGPPQDVFSILFAEVPDSNASPDTDIFPGGTRTICIFVLPGAESPAQFCVMRLSSWHARMVDSRFGEFGVLENILKMDAHGSNPCEAGCPCAVIWTSIGPIRIARQDGSRCGTLAPFSAMKHPEAPPNPNKFGEPSFSLEPSGRDGTCLTPSFGGSGSCSPTTRARFQHG